MVQSQKQVHMEAGGPFMEGVDTAGITLETFLENFTYSLDLGHHLKECLPILDGLIHHLLLVTN